MSGVEHGVEVASAQVTAAVAIEELKALVLKEDIIITIIIIIPLKLHCALSLSVWMAEEDIQTSKDQTFIAQGNEFASALVHVALGCKARTESTAGKKTQTNKPQLSVSVAVSYHLPATPFGSRSPHIPAVDGQDAGEVVRTRAWHPRWACYKDKALGAGCPSQKHKEGGKSQQGVGLCVSKRQEKVQRSGWRG